SSAARDPRVRRPRCEPRRPGGDDPPRGRADRFAPALHDPRDRAVGPRGAAALPQRRRGARDRPRPAGAPRPPARGRAGARTHARRPALGPARDRPRPAPVRRPAARRAGSHGAAPSPARTQVRPRPAHGARSGPRRPRARFRLGAACLARIVVMSHLDELDDFEAELELRIKKEYSAVYGLFRYCVLTQEATYLCNKLDLQYVPQPSYPFFQAK